MSSFFRCFSIYPETVSYHKRRAQHITHFRSDKKALNTRRKAQNISPLVLHLRRLWAVYMFTEFSEDPSCYSECLPLNTSWAFRILFYSCLTFLPTFRCRKNPFFFIWLHWSQIFYLTFQIKNRSIQNCPSLLENRIFKEIIQEGVSGTGTGTPTHPYWVSPLGGLFAATAHLGAHFSC